MQALIPVALRYAEPVFQSPGIRSVHIRDNRIREPALGLLPLRFAIDHYSYGKKVKDVLHSIVLLLHLVPNRIYRLGSSLYLEFKTFGKQFFLYRSNKFCDIGVAPRLGFVQFMGDTGIDLAVAVLQRHILKLRLDGIQAEAVRQRRIQIVCLVGRITHEAFGRMVVYSPHQCKTIHYHYDNHAYIFRECKKQLAEVIAFNRGALAIQRSHFVESSHKLGHIIAPHRGDIGRHYPAGTRKRRQQHGKNHVAVRLHAATKRRSSGYGRKHGIESETVAHRQFTRRGGSISLADSAEVARTPCHANLAGECTAQ